MLCKIMVDAINARGEFAGEMLTDATLTKAEAIQAIETIVMGPKLRALLLKTSGNSYVFFTEKMLDDSVLKFRIEEII